MFGDSGGRDFAGILRTSQFDDSLDGHGPPFIRREMLRIRIQDGAFVKLVITYYLNRAKEKRKGRYR